MIQRGSTGSSVPNPNLSDNMLAFVLAQASFSALSNHVTANATIQAAAVAPYTAVTSPVITRKSSGLFLVWATCTISINAGSMAAADSVTYSGFQVTPGPAGLLNPAKTTAAVNGATGAAAGYTIVADLNLFFLAVPGIALGQTASWGLRVTGVDALAHTSGVIAGSDGNIVVIELPG